MCLCGLQCRCLHPHVTARLHSCQCESFYVCEKRFSVGFLDCSSRQAATLNGSSFTLHTSDAITSIFVEICFVKLSMKTTGVATRILWSSCSLMGKLKLLTAVQGQLC